MVVFCQFVLNATGAWQLQPWPTWRLVESISIWESCFCVALSWLQCRTLRNPAGVSCFLEPPEFICVAFFDDLCNGFTEFSMTCAKDDKENWGRKLVCSWLDFGQSNVAQSCLESVWASIWWQPFQVQSSSHGQGVQNRLQSSTSIATPARRASYTIWSLECCSVTQN